jgi:hypothetical protein
MSFSYWALFFSACCDDEKSKYQQQAEKNKAQYEKDMEAYNNGLYGKSKK